MALPTTSKKVFTTLAFQSGATLHRSKLHELTTTEIGNLTTPVAGELAYGGDTHLKLYDGSNWQNIHRTGVPLSTGSSFTVSVAGDKGNAAGGGGTGSEPFIVTSKKVVANLNAGYLNNRVWDEDKTGDTIAARDGQGRIKVGTPAKNDSDDYAASKGYVDSVAQGLTIIDPAYLATAAALPACTYDNGTSDDGVGATLTGNANGSLTIDGSAVSSSQRIVVKDQSTAAQNGIYTVTNAGGGSAAFVLTRATDYDTPAEINDGDFIFIQQGSTNANRGFVQTENTWSTAGTMGSSNIAFTQFSGAGQISVANVTAATNPAHTTPLFKQGDTINFGYNSSHFAVDTNGNLKIASGGSGTGISSALLQNDAVTPDKLQDTGDFTMGGLTVNGAVGGTSIIQTSGTGTHSNSNVALDFVAPEGRLLSKNSSGGPASNLGLYTTDTSGTTNKVVHLSHDKKVGLGLDYGPSGTLHVSTARYGGDVISGWNFSNWGKISTNVTINSSNSVTTTAANDWWRKDGFLVVGRKYKIQLVGTKDANVDFYIRNHGGSAMSGASTISGTSFDSTQTITADSTGIMLQVGGAATFTFTKIEIVEDSLATTPSTTADDLVINNGLSQAGLTILGSGGARIHFGESGNSAHSRIIATYNSSKDSNLLFSASDNGTAGTVMTLFGNDKSAKFAGGVGVGGVAAGTDAVLRIRNENDSSYWPLVIENDNGNKTTIFTQSGGGDPELHFRTDGQSTTTILRANGTSYFNGGPVAIGATGAAQKLQVDGSIQLTNTAQTSSNFATNIQSIIFGDETANTGARHQASINAVREAWSNSPCKLTFKTAAGVNAATTKLEIASDGTQDHKANSIVNSATVAGLQDGGACYFFNGGSSYITFDSFAGALATNDAFTISIWFKSPSGLSVSSNSQILISAHSSGNSNILRIGVDANAATATGIFYSDGQSGDATLGSQKYQDDEWHHLVVSRPSGANAQTAKFYVDGVQIATDDIGPTFNDVAKWSIGQEYDGGTSDFFDGSIKDVKIFPSELDAGDIRKLYSGENPKKNNNVELISNGDFSDSIGSEWAGSTDATLTQNNGQLTVTSSGSNYGAAYAPISITEGKTYLLTFDMVDTDANSYIRVGTIDATNKTGSSQVSSNILSNAVVADGTTVRTVFVASSSQASDGYLAFGGRNDMTTLVLDNVSLTEVGTLVEFNPQSASSTTWRNEAIPSLYNGTVNNATLSQGNTYWNNIKQDGAAVKLLTSATIESESDAGLTLDRTGAGGQAQLAYKSQGVLKTQLTSNYGDNKFYLYHGGANALVAESNGDITINTKLGVGTSADASIQMTVAGAGSQVMQVKSTDSHASVQIDRKNATADANLMLMTNGVSKWRLATGLAGNDEKLSIYDDIANTNMMTFESGVGVAIGGTIANEKLHVRGATDGGFTGIRIQNDDGGSSTDETVGLRFLHTSSGADGGRILSGRETNYAGANSWADANSFLAFHTATANSDAERLRIGSDGTQDHKGNRIVNSQTLNDSWRSSEPSLRFDGDGDYVNCGTGLLTSTEITIAVWVKTDDKASPSIQGIVTNGHTGSGRRDLIINGSQFTFHQDTTDNRVNASTAATTNNTWHHVAVTSETNSSGNTEMKMYLNGVLVSTDTATGILTGYNDACYLGRLNSDARTLKGELKDVRIHNRALEADEIKGLYNGEATPYKYADADPSYFYDESGSYTYWSGGGNHSASVSSNILTATASGASDGSSNAVTISASNVGTFVTGKTYKWQFQAKLGSGTTSATLRARTPFDHSDVTTGSYKDFVLTSDWVTYEIIGTQIAVENAYFGIIAANAYNANVDIRNIKASEAGEVAAYTPQSIGETGGKWSDTTSNSNHGTITGAANVGENIFGALKIKGASNKNRLQIFGTEGAANERLEIYHDGSSANIISTASGGTQYTLNQFARQFYFYTWRNSAWTNSIHLATDGAVKATSADSDNLKQVARVHSENLDGDGSTKDFIIVHNLGTPNIVVSVRSRKPPFEQVECAVMCNENTSSTDTNSLNKCLIRFATAPKAAVGNTPRDEYKVTVIG